MRQLGCDWCGLNAAQKWRSQGELMSNTNTIAVGHARGNWFTRSAGLLLRYCAIIGMLSAAPAAQAQGQPDVAWINAGHAGAVESIAISPSGTLLASASPGDYTVKIWKISSGALLRTIIVSFVAVHAVAFSADSQSVIVGQDSTFSRRDAALKRYSVASGDLVGSYDPGMFYNVSSVAVSPDGTTIAAGCSDGEVRLFDFSSGALLQELTSHFGNVSSVAFSPDGSRLASGAFDNKVKLWQVSSGALLRTFTGHTFFVSSVAFSPNGSTLASGGWDRTIRLWNPDTGAAIKTITGPVDAVVYAIAYAPDGLTIASAGSEAAGNAIVRIWDIASSTVLRTMSGHAAATNTLRFTSDGAKLASGGADGLSIFWTTSTGSASQTLGTHRGPVNAVTFSPDGTITAAGDMLNPSDTGGDVELLSTRDGSLIRRLSGHMDRINSVNFSHDGARVVTAAGSLPPDTHDSTVRVWNVNTGAQLLVLSGHVGGSTAAAFSNNDQLIATTGHDKAIRIWNADSGALMTTIANAHSQPINALAFSPDGTYLASSAEDAKLKLWRTSDWGLARTMVTDFGGSALDFTSDSQFIAVSLNGYGDNIQLRRVSDGGLVRAYSGDPNGFVQSLDISPDNATIVSCSGYTHVMQLWNLADGSMIAQFDRECGSGSTATGAVKFAPDGAHFAIARADASIVLANFDVGCIPAGPDTNCDGVVNIDDLLNVITSWGPCPDRCPADIDHNGVVNIDDLLAVITGWG
jgi:WD40 repeat protein